VYRLGTNLATTQATADYFAPTGWKQLDSGDTDLGGSGAVLFDVPGATPSELVMALGKDGNAYLFNRNNLGGIGTALATKQVSNSAIINAEAAYRTSQGSYVVFRGSGAGCPPGTSGPLVAVKIAAANPPTLSVAWCAGSGGAGSPMVTTTDGTADAVVWWIAAGGDDKIHGFDGDTGAIVFDGGSDVLSNVARFSTPIAAKGRLFAATASSVVAFTTN
jgi:hypothetical protein